MAVLLGSTLFAARVTTALPMHHAGDGPSDAIRISPNETVSGVLTGFSLSASPGSPPGPDSQAWCVVSLPEPALVNVDLRGTLPREVGERERPSVGAMPGKA